MINIRPKNIVAYLDTIAGITTLVDVFAQKPTSDEPASITSNYIYVEKISDNVAISSANE